MLDENEDDQSRLVHVVLITTTAPAATLAAIANGLGQIGGQLRGLVLKPVGTGFEAALRLTGFGEAGAERFAALLMARPDAGLVRLEHLLPLP